MTTTSIKDVGSALNLGTMAVNNAGKTVDGAFQDVWNNQTGRNQTLDRKVERNSQPEKVSKPGDGLRVRDSGRNNVRGTESEPAELTEEQLEEAAENVSAALADLIQQIAETFEVPVEDVEQLMAEMELQPADLLQPENLSNLLMQVSGTEDSLALLTDEGLYRDFKAILEQGGKVLEQVSSDLGVPAENLQAALLERAKENEPDVPVLEDGEKQEAVFQAPEAAENVLPVNDETQQARQDGAQNRRQEEHTDSHSHHENLMLQGIRQENFEVQTEGLQEISERFTPDTREIMDQIMDYMKVQIKADVSSMEMQLHPASLGTLQIQVASKGGVLTANFITQNEAVRAALESQMVQLKESFAQQGVKVEAIEVTVGTHQFEQNLEQGRGRQPQETEGRKPRTRRIQLTGLEETETLEPAEQIVAEMMAADGNTVDYTA